MNGEEKQHVGAVGVAKWMKHGREEQPGIREVSVAESVRGHTSGDRPGGCEKVELRKIVFMIAG
jgi:hypothetical protein